MQNLFEKFGGTRAMADHLGEPPSTVNSWKATGRVPATKQPAVLETAQRLGLDVGPEDVIFPLGRDYHAASDTIDAVDPSAGKSGDLTSRDSGAAAGALG